MRILTIVLCQNRFCLRKYNGMAFGYGNAPIKILGTFLGLLKANGLEIESEILVASQNCKNLLGDKDCQRLGLIIIVNTVSEFVTKYPNVFGNRVGRFNKKELRIHINYDIPPVVQKLRRVCFHQRDQIACELSRLEKNGIIERVPDDTPTTWVSNIIPVIKKDGGLRICNDSKQVNEAILTERCLMPTPEDIRFKLNGMKVLSQLDLNEAYLQFGIDRRDRHVTTFTTHIGLFWYNVLFFGLKSAPELFQKTLSELLRDIVNAINVSDGILVFGRDLAEHDWALDQVLGKINDANLTLNLSKCEFRKNSLIFYGMHFSGDGVSPTEARVKAFREAASPKTSGEVRSILSSVQFSAGFIKDLATIADPLRELSHDRTKFIWTPVHEKSLVEIKNALTTTALAHFNVLWLTEIETDASPVGQGASLRQSGRSK